MSSASAQSTCPLYAGAADRPRAETPGGSKRQTDLWWWLKFPRSWGLCQSPESSQEPLKGFHKSGKVGQSHSSATAYMLLVWSSAGLVSQLQCSEDDVTDREVVLPAEQKVL